MIHTWFREGRRILMVEDRALARRLRLLPGVIETSLYYDSHNRGRVVGWQFEITDDTVLSVEIRMQLVPLDRAELARTRQKKVQIDDDQNVQLTLHKAFQTKH